MSPGNRLSPRRRVRRVIRHAAHRGKRHYAVYGFARYLPPLGPLKVPGSQPIARATAAATTMAVAISRPPRDRRVTRAPLSKAAARTRFCYGRIPPPPCHRFFFFVSFRFVAVRAPVLRDPCRPREIQRRRMCDAVRGVEVAASRVLAVLRSACGRRLRRKRRRAFVSPSALRRFSRRTVTGFAQRISFTRGSLKFSR